MQQYQHQSLALPAVPTRLPSSWRGELDVPAPALVMDSSGPATYEITYVQLFSAHFVVSIGYLIPLECE
jgi:hypothetical protein